MDNIVISFVIIFHPRRLNNLQQTLRFLSEEPIIQNSELVLCCQTHIDKIDSPFKYTKVINLESENYHKPKMTNEGVKQASHNIIVLLDSDRILPKYYFSETCKSLQPNQIITTKYLYELAMPYTDDEIKYRILNKKPDHRSEHNESRKKNLFSGNTIMWKTDFWNVGGYDEQFLGYGFADNDMTHKVQHMDCIYLPRMELHLYHDLLFDLNHKTYSKGDYQIICAINALKYHQKWQLDLDESTKDLISIIGFKFSMYRKEHQDLFLQLLKPYNLKPIKLY